MVKKVNSPSKRIKETSELICYHCGKEILNSVDVVFKPILRKTKNTKFINRVLHRQCLDDYDTKAENIEFKRVEQDDWDKCYQYFKNEYMGGDKLLEHAVRRLLGLRLGQYYPDGNNTRILKRGYPYSTIYKAMVVAKSKAKSYASTIQFADYDHKVNTFMKFIVDEVEDVQMRLDRIAKDNIALEKAVEKNKQDNVQYVDYMQERLEGKVNTQQSEDKRAIKADVNKLWGLDLDDDDY